MSGQSHKLVCRIAEKSCRAGATRGLLAAAWVVSVVLGLQILTVHALTPGAVAPSRGTWPTDSELHLAPEGLSLLVFAHPHCSCLAATFEELAAIRAASHGPLPVTIVFCRPPEAPVGWERTPAWQAAESQPGVEVTCDRSGAEARRFGIETSGHALLYASDGRLLFTGGITGARGHAGENPNRLALLAAALNLQSRAGASAFVAPVYGCPLFTACTLEKPSCPR